MYFSFSYILYIDSYLFYIIGIKYEWCLVALLEVLFYIQMWTPMHYNLQYHYLWYCKIHNIYISELLYCHWINHMIPLTPLKYL